VSVASAPAPDDERAPSISPNVAAPAREAIAAVGVAVHQPGESIGVEAARLRCRHPISLPDAYCLATAKHAGASVASFDRKVIRAAEAERFAHTASQSERALPRHAALRSAADRCRWGAPSQKTPCKPWGFAPNRTRRLHKSCGRNYPAGLDAGLRRSLLVVRSRRLVLGPHPLAPSRKRALRFAQGGQATP
jgi:hypothetical protein